MLSSMWALWLSVALRTDKAVWSCVLAGITPILDSPSETPDTACVKQIFTITKWHSKC